MTPETEYTEAERNAMRAYLARAEVRMSTLHRIATAFISGAGLLILVPVFLKDAVDNLLLALLRSAGNQFPQWGTAGGWLTVLLYGLLMYPFLLSLAIPLYGVFLLVKDVVHFYFTLYMPGFSSDLRHPSLAMPVLSFSPDDSARVKQDVMRLQYSNMSFMLPFSEGRRNIYFDAIHAQTEGQITPSTRTLEALQAADVLPPNADLHQVQQFNTAYGIARGLDRSLVAEVALTEMLLARHVLYLRRLVLRYVKTLLMFIWTTLIAFLLLPLLQDSRLPVLVVIGAGYSIWATAVMGIVKLPVYWIYRHRHHDGEHVQQLDAQLTRMEQRIRLWARLSAVSAWAGFLLAIYAYLMSA